MSKDASIPFDLAAYAVEARASQSLADDLEALALLAEEEEMPSLAASARVARRMVQDFRLDQRAAALNERLGIGEALRAATAAPLPEA